MYETHLDRALGKKTMGATLIEFERLLGFEKSVSEIISRLELSGAYAQIVRDPRYDVIVLVHHDRRREFLTPERLHALFRKPSRPVLRLVP